MDSHIIYPIADFKSPYATKFGAPRQSGLVDVPGEIVFRPDYRSPDALRGIDDFEYLWLVWLFSENRHAATAGTVRPPRLGGNTRLGVWATRSPYRPNAIGLSTVRLLGVDRDTPQGPILRVLGADLIDSTPIVDIKPYIPYADAHPDARAGFTDDNAWQPLLVNIAPEVEALFTPDLLKALRQTLEQDPRPHYHDDPKRVYGLLFAGHDLHFTVDNRRQLNCFL